MPTTEVVAAAEPGVPGTAPAAHGTDCSDHPDWRSLWAMLAMQAQNVFNDKIAQFMLVGLAGVLAGQMIATDPELIHSTRFHALDDYPQIISLLLALPFLLFAPVSGWVADRFSKRKVLIWCLWIQAASLTWIIGFLLAHKIWLATAGFFFLAIQSTLLSPAKMGICKELVGGRHLARAVGWMQMLVVVSIIIGTIIGGQAFSSLDQALGGWNAAWILVTVLLAASSVQLLFMLRVRQTPAHATEPFQAKLWWAHFGHLTDLLRVPELRRASLAIAFFWFAGGVSQLVLILVGKEVRGLNSDAIAQASILNGMVGVGIAMGSIYIAWLSRNGIRLGVAPWGAAGMTLGLVGATLLDPSVVPANPADFTLAAAPYLLSLTALGFFGAMFLVPLNAFVQDRADPARRGRITSAINLLNALGGLGAIAMFSLLSAMDLASPWHFGVLAGMTLLAGLYVMRLSPASSPAPSPAI